ncbi:hypothetical protein D3C72_1832040 [compost metagenome]
MFMMTDSVTSSCRRCGSRPVSFNMAATMPAMLPRSNCFTDRLTAIFGTYKPCACQRIIWRHASSSTHLPSWLMKPLSSASGMKRAGGTRPSSGWFQRTSASTPTRRPVSISTCGW